MIRLKKDWVIPAGTTFTDISGMTMKMGSENYEAVIGTSKDSIAFLNIDSTAVEDRPDLFEEVADDA